VPLFGTKKRLASNHFGKVFRNSFLKKPPKNVLDPEDRFDSVAAAKTGLTGICDFELSDRCGSSFRLLLNFHIGQNIFFEKS